MTPHPFHTQPIAASVRSCISKPAFWVLTGTIMLPLNLIIAIVFWVQAMIWRNEGRERLARSLNVQLTYTLVFFIPIFLAELFTSPSYRETFPSGAMRTLVVGLFFGLTGLAGVIVLIFSNTRMFAGEVLGHDVPAPLRIRFVKE